MATLDKTQGIIFIYKSLHRRNKEGQKQGQGFLALKKERKEQSIHRSFPVPMGVKEAEERIKQQSQRKYTRNPNSLTRLKKNMDKLSQTHAKLHFLLKELEGIVKKNS